MMVPMPYNLKGKSVSRCDAKREGLVAQFVVEEMTSLAPAAFPV